MNICWARHKDSRRWRPSRSPKLENPVPDCVVVEGIWGRHRVRDIELFPICHFLWWTLHPGHFQTCENTHAPPEHTHSNCACMRAHSWAPHTSFWVTKAGNKVRFVLNFNIIERIKEETHHHSWSYCNHWDCWLANSRIRCCQGHASSLPPANRIKNGSVGTWRTVQKSSVEGNTTETFQPFCVTTATVRGDVRTHQEEAEVQRISRRASCHEELQICSEPTGLLHDRVCVCHPNAAAWPFSKPLPSPLVQLSQEALQSPANLTRPPGLTFTAPKGHRFWTGELPPPPEGEASFTKSRTPPLEGCLSECLAFSWTSSGSDWDAVMGLMNFGHVAICFGFMMRMSRQLVLEAAPQTLWTLHLHILVGLLTIDSCPRVWWLKQRLKLCPLVQILSFLP